MAEAKTRHQQKRTRSIGREEHLLLEWLV